MSKPLFLYLRCIGEYLENVTSDASTVLTGDISGVSAALTSPLAHPAVPAITQGKDSLYNYDGVDRLDDSSSCNDVLNNIGDPAPTLARLTLAQFCFQFYSG
eukprot:10318056-Ditylum_brightwellii.AAC.1